MYVHLGNECQVLIIHNKFLYNAFVNLTKNATDNKKLGVILDESSLDKYITNKIGLAWLKLKYI